MIDEYLELKFQKCMDRMLRKKEEEKERSLKRQYYPDPVPDTGSNRGPDNRRGESEPNTPKCKPAGGSETDRRLDKWIGVPITAIKTRHNTSDTVPEAVSSAREPRFGARTKECCQFRHGAGQTGPVVSVEDE